MYFFTWEVGGAGGAGGATGAAGAGGAAGGAFDGGGGAVGGVTCTDGAAGRGRGSTSSSTVSYPFRPPENCDENPPGIDHTKRAR